MEWKHNSCRKATMKNCINFNAGKTKKTNDKKTDEKGANIKK